jgi:hypothetical protein
MNNEDSRSKAVKMQLLSTLAANFRIRLHPPIASEYLLALDALPPDIGIAGLRRAIREAKCWPTIPGLLKFCEILGSPAEVPGEIYAAISRFGRYNGRLARQALSPHCYDLVVSMFGTWENACELITHDNWPTISAQLRFLAENKQDRRQFNQQLCLGE